MNTPALRLAGPDAGNYTVNTTATTTANITVLAIIGSITAANKTYDGTTAATITGRSLTGAIVGDTVSYVGGKIGRASCREREEISVAAASLKKKSADAGN